MIFVVTGNRLPRMPTCRLAWPKILSLSVNSLGYRGHLLLLGMIIETDASWGYKQMIVL
jgi:hypothetical protein